MQLGLTQSNFCKQMDYKPYFLAAWFGASITSLAFATLFLVYLSQPKTVTPVSQNFNLYAALPSDQTEVISDISYQDARAKIVENFFKNYKAPLAQYSNEFIKVADEYKLDFRLLPAISMQESNGGRRIINNSHNPFGYGIYANKVTKFSSWEEAIEAVGKGLKENYLDEGLITPEQIMVKYTPPSVEKGGFWAKGVRTFMEELR